ncbi:MAG TPA: Ku protein [Pirellulales bacterium]|nr:Ku protein [Pirellulales bacterium]
MARIKRKGGPRASWKGVLRIDLVAFEVEAVSAIEPGGGKVHFHQLHRPCHSRIRYEKVCPIHGVVPNDEIVLGYEHGKNKYVEIDPDELDAARTKAQRELTLDTFIDPAELDPIYFDGRTYVLIPSREEFREPYSVVAAALKKMDRFGIGQIIFSEREQLAAVRPKDGMLLMAMLHHEHDLRSLDDLKPPTAKVQPKKIDLAETLINASTEPDFDIGHYRDTYQKKIEQLIGRKLQGEDIVEPEEEEEQGGVISLMDALKKSVAKAHGHKRRAAPHAASKTKRPSKRTSTARRRKRAS